MADGNRAALWLIVPHLICCGGAALLLLVSGAGLAGVGVVRASFWLLVLGFVVIGAALMWKRRRQGASDSRVSAPPPRR